MPPEIVRARRLLRLLAARPDVPTCFACLEREFRVRRVVIEAVILGAASTLSNVEIGSARCSVCSAGAPTVRYRA